MKANKVRVVKYSDDTSFEYPYSNCSGFNSKTGVLRSMIKHTMKRRGIDDLENTYADNILRVLKSVVYNNISSREAAEKLSKQELFLSLR